MQIIDKYGYLENAFDYIDRQIVSGRGLKKISKKTGMDEDLLKSLSSVLKDFSEKQFFCVLEEKIEEKHGSAPDDDIEISEVDLSVEREKGKALVLMNLTCDVAVDGEQEDKIKIEIKIFSKNNIK